MKLTDEERAVWSAAYGAAFAAQYMIHYGHGESLANSPATRFVIAEESRTIADEAVSELRRSRPDGGERG